MNSLPSIPGLNAPTCTGTSVVVYLLAMVVTPASARAEKDTVVGQQADSLDPQAPDLAARSVPQADCSVEQDAARISGEIVVCRELVGPQDDHYDRDQARQRHAQQTMDANLPRAPDVEGSNDIPQVKVEVTINGCFIPPCPPPPVYMIDFSKLPEAPPGSDAEKVARGLPPNSHTTHNEH
jgi:hypothetical protein